MFFIVIKELGWGGLLHDVHAKAADARLVAEKQINLDSSLDRRIGDCLLKIKHTQILFVMNSN